MWQVALSTGKTSANPRPADPLGAVAVIDVGDFCDADDVVQWRCMWNAEGTAKFHPNPVVAPSAELGFNSAGALLFLPPITSTVVTTLLNQQMVLLISRLIQWSEKEFHLLLSPTWPRLGPTNVLEGGHPTSPVMESICQRKGFNMFWCPQFFNVWDAPCPSRLISSSYSSSLVQDLL